MTKEESVVQFSEIVLQGMREGVAKAIERHRCLGESIVVMKDGKIIEIPADQIPPVNIFSNGQP
jgi:hypothetical protein